MKTLLIILINILILTSCKKEKPKQTIVGNVITYNVSYKTTGKIISIDINGINQDISMTYVLNKGDYITFKISPINDLLTTLYLNGSLVVNTNKDYFFYSIQ